MQTRSLYGSAVEMILARTTADTDATAWDLADRPGFVRGLADASWTVINHVADDGFGQIVGKTSRPPSTASSSPGGGSCWRFKAGILVCPHPSRVR